jgi:hypothetical protein
MTDASNVPLIPREVLFGNLEKVAPRLSPDGERLAYLAPKDGAIEEKGIDYEYLVFEDEGNGFARPENRLKFYAAAERFLAKHLGGRAEE